MEKIHRILKNEDCILLGEDKYGALFPMKNMPYDNESKYAYLDKASNYAEKSINL